MLVGEVWSLWKGVGIGKVKLDIRDRYIKGLGEVFTGVMIE